jgi:hypothetical protein
VIKKIFTFIFISGFLFLLGTNRVYATLTGVKDTISTSRPSSSTPLAADLGASATLVTILDNGSRFIASDSAKLIGGTLEVINIASMSAADNPSAGQRKVYFSTANSNTHNKGTVIMVPVTAKHTISLSTSPLSIGGTIQVVFPVGDTSDLASPSASGFSFNDLAAANISVSGASCDSPITVDSATGKIACVLSSALSSPQNSVTLTIGANTPSLINPTKTAAAGTADAWTINVSTFDSGGVQLDLVKARVGTIDSVEAYATVDPTFSFTIQGRTTAQGVNIGNTIGCTSTDTINTGFNSTATDVNLGTLSPSTKSISSQLLTISTNSTNGYVLTATTSGHFTDPSVGYWLPDAQGIPTDNDTPGPATITAGSPAFGIHPCGTDVSATGVDWGTAGDTGAKFANPSPSYYYSLATDTSGPVVNGATGDGIVTVVYSAAVSAAVPAGYYKTTLTYVATPVF